MDRERTYPVKTFDPLLRDLVAWDLVVHTETEAGSSWRLTEAVQSRLDEIVSRVRFSPNGPLVYLDHRCADCQRRGLTRLLDGVYLCEACADHRTAGALEQDRAPTSGARRKGWRRRSNATHGSRQLAG